VKDYIAIAAQYQADVLAGTVPACKWVRLACERNRRDLDRQSSEGFPYVFNPEKGRRVCQMAEMLPHIKGPEAYIIGRDDQDRPIWNTIKLEPWQCWLLATLFGWEHEQTGRRRFRIALWLIPRKNAKSTLGAIVTLFMLTADGEGGAECYSAATTRDQAKIVAEIVWEMARRSPAFREFFGVKMGSKTSLSLSVPATGSKFAPLSADAHSLDGLNVHLAVPDELHAHKTRGVWDVLDTATGARLQAMILAITTAGVEIGGICHEKLQYLERVLEGTVSDESFFGINYTIDVGDDITSVEVQKKANPNYGVSVQADDLARKVAEAQISQSALNNVLTKHFNVWIRTESAWMGSDTWQGCKADDLTIESLRGVPCWIGVDLGETRDPSSLSLLFKRSADTYALLTRIYMPQAVIDKSPIAQLGGWARQGHIIATPGNEADYARITDDLLSLFASLTVREIDFDRRSARLMMQTIRQRLEATVGRDRAERVVLDIPQNLDTMDPAMKATEAMVLGKRLQHDGNPAMAWMIANVVVERDHKGQIYPRKAGGKDSHNKIDGAVSLFTAISRAMAAVDPTPSFQMFTLGR
jgi:phage terminase large subunit-like protein